MFLILIGALFGQVFPIFFPEPFMKFKIAVLKLIDEAKK